jgi:hypothetical protein
MRIPIEPKLPANFDCCPNESRPASHRRWWYRPYIKICSWAQMERHMSTSEDRAKWFAAWPSGIRFDVRCLDGGAWDRSTCHGMFPTLKAALAAARELSQSFISSST